MAKKRPKNEHVCNPPSLARSSPSVDIVRWRCSCGKTFEKRYRVSG